MKSNRLKLLLSTVGIVVLLAGTPFVYAAGQQQGMEGQSMNKQSQSQLNLSRSYQSDHIIGIKVRNNNGQDIGKISQIIFDDNGQATYVVLSTGGILGMATKDYVVPWSRLNLRHGQKYASIDVQKDQVSSEFSAFEEQQQQPSKTEQPGEEESD